MIIFKKCKVPLLLLYNYDNCLNYTSALAFYLTFLITLDNL